MNYKIEKDIPIPSGEFPFQDMEVGDSFIAGDFSESLRSKITSRAHAFKKLNNCMDNKYITKNVGNKIRVWRIK